jgi:hypothetical protein
VAAVVRVVHLQVETVEAAAEVVAVLQDKRVALAHLDKVLPVEILEPMQAHIGVRVAVGQVQSVQTEMQALALVVLVLHTLQQTMAAAVVVVLLLTQAELAAAALAVVQVLRLVFLAQQILAVAVVVLHRHHLRVTAQVAQVEAASSASAISARQSDRSRALVTLHPKRVATPSIPSSNPGIW